MWCNPMSPSITVNKISKLYRVGTKLTNLRELFSLRRDAKDINYRWAVKDVSFELQPGESLGVIGPNGAGKTTILKMLSQVTRPTTGAIKVDGRLSALIELGAGFHPDLTGRENIFLNGTILGMRRSEIQAKFDEIIDFAGIGEYLDTPVKRYSSGMYARLGFAIAAHVDPHVLLVDEVLAVGDYAFQMKCYERMDKLRKNGTTLIFVSHNMDVVRRVCDKGLVLYRGQNVYFGPAVEAVVAYSDAVRGAAREMKLTAPKENGLSERVMTFDAEIDGIQLLDVDGNPIRVVESVYPVNVAVNVKFSKEVKEPVFSLTIRSSEGTLIYDVTTRWLNIQTPTFSSGDQCQVRFLINTPLIDGEYVIGVDVVETNMNYYYDRLEHGMGFWVKGSPVAKGLADLTAKVSIEKAINK